MLEDDAIALPLLRRIVGGRGSQAAWEQLWFGVAPAVWNLTSDWTVTGRLSRSTDDRLNIVVDFFDRLRADDHRRVRCYLQRRDTGQLVPFKAWVLVVAKRVAIDYVRRFPELGLVALLMASTAPYMNGRRHAKNIRHRKPVARKKGIYFVILGEQACSDCGATYWATHCARDNEQKSDASVTLVSSLSCSSASSRDLG
jgi:hypothetical protein